MHKKEEEVKIEVKVDEDIANGVYVNFSNVSHSPEEFVLDFIFVHPTPPPGFGKLMARVILTPAHAKRFQAALAENIAEYESRFGVIKLPSQLDQGNLQ